MKSFIRKVFKYKPTKVVASLGIISLLLSIYSSNSFSTSASTGNYVSVVAVRYFGSEIIASIVLSCILLFITYRLFKFYKNNTAALGGLLVSISSLLSILMHWATGAFGVLQEMGLQNPISNQLFVDGTSLLVLGILTFIISIIGAVILGLGLSKRISVENNYIHLLLVWSAVLSFFNPHILGFFIVLWVIFEIKENVDSNTIST